MSPYRATWVLIASLVPWNAHAGPRQDGRRLEAQGRLEEAAGVYRSTMVLHPKHDWARRRLQAVTAEWVQTLVDDAQTVAATGDLPSALKTLASAQRVIDQCAAEGLSIDSMPLPKVEDELRREQVERVLKGPFVTPLAHVAAFRSALAVGPRSDQGELRNGLLEALRALAAAQPLDVDVLDEIAMLSGLPEDQRVAADGHGALGDEAMGRGDCRAASDAFIAATQRDPRWAGAVARADACARTDVVIELSGDKEVTEALRVALIDALKRLGSRHVHVVRSSMASPRTVTSGGEPREVPAARVALRVLRVDERWGEGSSQRATRPDRAVTVVIETWEKPVTSVVQVGVTSTIDGEVVKAVLTEQATQTARWDGRAKAVRTPIGGHQLKGAPRSGERSGAEAQAAAEALGAAVRVLASQVAAEVLRRVDRPELPPRAPAP